MLKDQSLIACIELAGAIAILAGGLFPTANEAQETGGSHACSAQELSLPGLEGKMSAGEQRTYVHPDSEGVIRGRQYTGIKFDLTPERAGVFEGQLTAKVPEGRTSQLYSPNVVTFSTTGDETETVYLTWDDFNRPEAVDKWVNHIKELSFSGSFTDGEGGSVNIQNVRLVKGDVLMVSSPRRGKAAPAGEPVSYEITVRNLRKEALAVDATLGREGWETMTSSVDPGSLELEPGASKTIQVRVTPTDSIPKGAYEKQAVRLLPEGNAEAAEEVELFTSRELPGPNLVHDAEGWTEVRRKAENYDWARKKKKNRVQRARNWNVPTSRFSGGNPSPGEGGVFRGPNVAREVYNTAVAWQLTRDRAFAEKVATFLRRLTDPETGYLATHIASERGSVIHEGSFIANAARSYDLITDADVLTGVDHRRFASAVRIYKKRALNGLRSGWMANMSVAQNAAAIFAALAIDDMAMAHRFIHMPGGMIDRFGAGFMPDGWWFEATINYNLGITNRFLALGIALDRRGVDWLNKEFPLKLSDTGDLRPNIQKDQKAWAGITYDKWGPPTRSSLSLEDVYEGLLPFMDYRGVAFGTNDGQAKQIGGEAFEMAYHVYRSPKYLPSLNRLAPEDRNLLWGVPDLPETPKGTEKPYEKSFHSDNIGYHVLRSQNDRPIEERIQGALKFGTHGGHHGHYDRGNLVYLGRHGRNIGTPKQPWFSYTPYFYKCFNQMSPNHNMVVVDQKNQFPVESEPPLLFHSGDLFQAGAMENNAPWSFMPPRNQDPMKNGKPLSSLRGYIPEFPDAPDNYNLLTGFTEDIRNRRLLIVTDDYAVLADDLQGDNEHTFDHSLWIRGLKEMSAPGKELARHDAQLTDDPRKPGQLMTNVDWYDVQGTLRADFSYEVESGSNLARTYKNEPGPMNVSVFHAWPRDDRVIGTCELPRSYDGGLVNRVHWQALDGAGEQIAEGTVKPWVIGKGKVDVDVEGMNEFSLSSNVQASSQPSLFWYGEAVTADGERITLADVPYSAENMRESEPRTKDYEGGAIRPAGEAVEKAIPAEPANQKHPSVVTFDLSDLNVVRVQATLASDHPVGNPERRRGLIARQTATSARFLTVIEPHADESVVKRVEAGDANTLTVKLTDGRKHTFDISGLDSPGGNIEVTMREFDGETLVQEETTGTN